MIVYSSTKDRFQADVMSNDIGNIVSRVYKVATGREIGRSELSSWTNSLQCMERIVRDDDIPRDVGIFIEYHIPQTSRRIDFILAGQDSREMDSIVLVELKQWDASSLTGKDAIVEVRYMHGVRETAHPSYQAWTYKRLLEDYNSTIQEEGIQVHPCAYLHNYPRDGVIDNPFYEDHIRNAPMFLKEDAQLLRDFIRSHIKYGDKTQVMYRVENGKIIPSKNLADQLASMLSGNEEYVLVDDQKVVFEAAIQAAVNQTEKKKVLIVEGGPGTGKSVVAINLLVELTRRRKVAQYVTRNSAPRLVYEAKLTGTMKKTHISNLFSGSGSFHSCPAGSIGCLIVDEAHRLNERSGMFSHLGENQIKEIISAAKCSVFFLDEDQKVTLKDVGDKEEIRRWAKALNASVGEMRLESQFRCNGSEGYLSWLDNALQVRPTANERFDAKDYDFRIIDDPSRLHSMIIEKNRERNKARLVAGYCWDWISKKHPKLKDIRIGDGYKATWNLDSDGQAWIIRPDSVSEVGCIHTCQGLEVDYIGVIIGPDLIVRDGKVITRPEARARTDKSINGWKRLVTEDPGGAKARLDAIIKNTYRTLMTRGQKGCYVYFVDEETRRYFEERLIPKTEPAQIGDLREVPTSEEAPEPFRRLDPEEVRPFENCVPLFDLRVAAGPFVEGTPDESITWVELPSGFKPHPDLFLAQVVGESMNRRIPSGAWCLFRRNPGGTRHGKIVLAQHREISDTETGGHFTVKYYESRKRQLEDGTWEHDSITLKPCSTSSEYQPIILGRSQVGELRIIAELVAVLT